MARALFGKQLRLDLPPEGIGEREFSAALRTFEVGKHIFNQQLSTRIVYRDALPNPKSGPAKQPHAGRLLTTSHTFEGATANHVQAADTSTELNC